jgi:hypothetical protein
MTENDAGSNAPWAQPRTSGGDGKSSMLFWAAMLVLGLFAWGGVTLGASSLLAKKGPEKLLRVELHLPKLNFSQGIRKAIPNHTSEPKSSAQAKPTTDLSKVKSLEAPKHVETKISTVEPPLSSPGAWLNPVAPPAPVAMETCQDPVVYLQPCSVQPGDSPMIRNWKTLTMYSLLATAASLAPPPVVVQAQETKGLVDNSDALKKLQKSVDALIERIDKLEKKPVTTDKDAIAEVFRTELKKLEEGALGDIRKDMKKIREDLSTVQAEQVRQKRDIDELNSQLESLRKKMLAAGSTPMKTPAIDKAFMEEFHSSMKALKDAIARLGPTKERTSAYPNGNATASTGQVVLVNMYNEDLLFILNGNGYSVPANSSKIVQAVPTGALSYQVHSERWGTLGNRTTSLAAGDTFTVTAR